MHYIACGGQDITGAVNPDLSKKACRALDLLFRKGAHTLAVHDGPGVGLALAKQKFGEISEKESTLQRVETA